MAKYNVSVTHIDTCLSCYLQDHHNRPGEALIGVYLDGQTTYQEIKDNLVANAWESAPGFISNDIFYQAIDNEFSTVSDMSAPFDDSLEINEDDNDWSEPVQAWFLIEWKKLGVDE